MKLVDFKILVVYQSLIDAGWPSRNYPPLLLAGPSSSGRMQPQWPDSESMSQTSIHLRAGIRGVSLALLLPSSLRRCVKLSWLELVFVVLLSVLLLSHPTKYQCYTAFILPCIVNSGSRKLFLEPNLIWSLFLQNIECVLSLENIKASSCTSRRLSSITGSWDSPHSDFNVFYPFHKITIQFSPWFNFLNIAFENSLHQIISKL